MRSLQLHFGGQRKVFSEIFKEAIFSGEILLKKVKKIKSSGFCFIKAVDLDGTWVITNWSIKPLQTEYIFTEVTWLS